MTEFKVKCPCCENSIIAILDEDKLTLQKCDTSEIEISQKEIAEKFNIEFG